MIYLPADIEANALENVTKIHCLSMNWKGEIKTTSSYDDMRKLICRKDITLVMHNGVMYDTPVLESLLGCRVNCTVVDTLAVSWYLYPKRLKHGLESWGEELGFPKVEVEESEWANMSYERAAERCIQDVKIQTVLWEKMQVDLSQLYGDNQETIERLLRYLSFKMYQFRLQDTSKFKVDILKIHENILKFEEIKKPQHDTLKEALPSAGTKTKKTQPKVMYKIDGSLSSNGKKWESLCLSRELPVETEEIEVIEHKESNPDSSPQIKEWLFSLGWEPINFGFDKKTGNKPPQIYIAVGEDKELCPSVKRLNHPAIKALDNYGVIKHRLNTLNGFLRKEKNGFLTQGVGGFTNTLRITHRDIVNVPKNSKPWGKYIREVFIPKEGNILCGADLNSLENKTRDHYIYPIDPDYVNEMSDPDFDSHTDTAVIAGLMTREEESWFKSNKKRENLTSEEKVRLEVLADKRQLAKTTNYSSVYGVGAKKLGTTLDIKTSEAKNLIEGFWKRNWAVKKFASTLERKSCLNLTWVLNPVTGFYYELRSDKDAFSTCNQSTGAYIFDVWLGYVLAKREQLTIQSHDDGQWELPDTEEAKDEMIKILEESIANTNKKLSLNVELSIDIKFGKNYSETH